tara:strand:+ start:519 stop:1256 length:738 start_codon:yes stop_codon:yes gene_type:complete
MNKEKSVVILFSGGCDSTVMLHMALEKYDKVYALMIDYGQRHSIELDYGHCYVNSLNNPKIDVRQIDLKCLRSLSPTSSLTNNDIDTPDVAEVRGEAQPASYVPFRNQIFLSLAMAFAESNNCESVWYGATKVDSMAGVWDADQNFIDRFNAVSELNREKKIKVHAPLLPMDKKDIVKWGVENGVDFSNTYTCYTGEGLPSITSASSSLRIQGFIENGWRDPLSYKEQELLNEKYDALGCIHIQL